MTNERTGRTPKIGRRTALEEMKREAERNIDDLAPSDEERKLGSWDAIVAHREAEKAALLGAVAGPPSPSPLVNLLARATGADSLAALMAAERQARQNVEDDDRRAAQALIEPHKKAGRAAIEKMTQIKNARAAEVAAMAGFNVHAILRRVPAEVVPGQDYALNHFRISQVITLARAINGAFKAFAPVDFTDALRDAEARAQGAPPTDMVFQNAVRHLAWHTGRLVASVDGIAEQLARFDELAKQVTADLAGVTPLDVEPEPKPQRLPHLPDTPQRQERAADWNPLEPPTPEPVGPQPIPIGDGAGYRFGPTHLPEWGREKVRIVGVTKGVN